MSRFARHFDSSPEHFSPEDVSAFLVPLGHEQRVSLNYNNQTHSALRFLNRVTLGRNDVPDAIPPVNGDVLAVWRLDPAGAVAELTNHANGRAGS
jgi:hypothetical protein